MRKTMFKAGALSAAATLGMMATAPAMAATTVAQADANAITVSVAGEADGSGTVTATHDGTAESVEGQANPPVGVLGNQQLANIGVLAQEATADVQNRNGISAACAGVAGEGGAVVQVGESWCLEPGDAPLDITFAHLDLSGVELVDPESALAPLAEVNPVVEGMLSQITGPLSDALEQATEPMGDVRIHGRADAVDAYCEAEPGSAEGDARVVNGQVFLTVNAETVALQDLEVKTGESTKVVTDLDEVLDAVLAAIEDDLEKSLDGALADVGGLSDQIRENIVDTLIGEIAPQLAPVEENLLDITLNEQAATDDSIEVTALSAHVLPAAEEYAGGPLVDAEVANVSCGPNARTAADNPGDSDGDDGGDNTGDSDGDDGAVPGDSTGGGTADSGDDGGFAGTSTPVPTAVDSGTAVNPFAPTASGTNAAALAGLMTAAAGLGLLAYRRWAL